MNKVFKVIWSEARNAYVVVSEMAKNHGAKSGSTKKLLAMLIATGVMTCASMAPAMADNPASDDANKGWNLSVNNGITAGTEVQPGGYVNFNGDGENIIVSATKEFFGPSVKVELSRNLNVDSIHAGDFFMNNEMGIGFGGDAYITTSGLNANNNVITNVAAGVADTDAVNVGQLKNSAWKLAANGALTEAEDVKAGEYVDFNGDQNVSVSKDAKDGVNTVKVELNKDLKVNSVNAGDYFFDAERGVGFGGDAYVTKSGLNANDKVITNVAAGTADTDAVNVGQLKNSAWKLAANGALTEAEDVKAGEYVDFNGDQNVSVSKDAKDGVNTVKVELNKDLKVNSVNAGDYFFDAERGVGFGGNAYITKNGLNANDKVITNVAAGVYNTDAVNVGQLKEVEEVAANANKGWNLSTNGVATKATNVAPGEIVDFSGDKNISVSHDGTKVQVELNKDIDVNSVQTNTVQTNVLNAKYNLSVGTANENGTVPFFVNSNGAFYGANGSFVVDKDGNVTAGNVVLKNGVFTGHSALRDGELFVGDASGSYSQITPKSAKLGQVTIDEKGNMAGVNSIQTNALNAKYNLSVGTANENGTVPFFVNSNGAFYGANGSFVVDKDGNVTAGNVVLKNGVFTGNSALRDGELFVGDASGNYSQITTKGAKLGKVTVAEDGKIHGVTAGTADTDAVNVSQLKAVGTTANMGWNLATNGVATEATNVKPGDFVDFSGDKNISVSHDGTKVQVELNKNIDVNYVQTNALNAKYNLSVGTANENGTVPFFVNSNGAFYGANGSFVVDKDGNVTAGNVVLKNGVFTGHSALRDGELFIGDNDGNYSQITPKSAKLGQVTIDEKGNIAGVNSIQTNALNAKYNLSVGTANENGTMPFFVNSNGAFYAANGKLVVDKDGKLVAPEAELGKVTADEGVIGNVVLKDGVFYKHTALRDGELFVGDADGNYSQITTKGAKLGKVTVAEDGKISGVAAGAVTADSTDAVNGSQLHAVATEAGKHTTLSNGKNTTVTSTNKDGQVDYQVNVAGDLKDITSVSNGDSKINLNEDSISISNGNKSFAITNSGIGMSYITADYSTKSIMLGENGTTISGGLNVAGSKITGVAAGVADTDAVNVGQLKEAVEAGNTDTHIKPGEYGVGADNKVNMDVVDKNGNKVDTVTIKDVAKASDVGDVNNIASDIKNKEGKTTVVDAVNNLNNKVGDLQYSKVEKGEIADGDSTTTAIGKLDQKLTDVAATAAKHTTVTQGDNITVTKSDKPNENGGENYNVALKKDIKLDSVTTGDTVMNKDGLKVGKDVSVTATAVTAGKTSISDEGVKVGDKTYISDKGLNANGQNITNVADGKVEKDSKDAINGGQLHQAKADINNRIDGVENQVVSNTNRINQLGSRVNKVGAGAAALAALHPMDFDPDDKLTFSAGYGNYGGENAAAIGAYYRPDEKVMFSVGGTVGNGENMVNAGVSFALDRTNHVSNSRTALAREVIDLRGQLAVMGAKMAKMEKAFGMLDETKTKLFPDIPANHWAYEYIAKLAGNGYIEGYPDGNFGGDRLMTRYEFAAMLYRAIENGAALEEKIIKEFEPELGRIRVDRISGEDGDRDKIERVRVNDTKGERDHYGNKLAK
ncbi:ESPR-type extended signal peptide-containing protein [Phascolarctobacterium succinatutens]|uniref:ESPR-type extended signal peptide-containing protein n=2 Tax=Phascolarctobacterium succinatutens TaxID=626940 RepID=UPI00307AE17B